MEKFILILHIIVCVVLVLAVLLQSGKDGMGVIFGGGSSSLFGGTGAGGLLSKMTAFLAVLFIVTSLSYNLISSDGTNSKFSVEELQVEDPSRPAPAVSPNATSPVTSTPQANGSTVQ